MTKKYLFHIIFAVSILGYLLDINLEYWLFLILSFFIVSVINLKEKFNYKFPIGEFMSLVFFIDNTFAFSLLYFLRGTQLHIGDFQYTQIEVDQYLPFSFLSSQAILIGYMAITQMSHSPWITFVTKFDTLINRNNFRTSPGVSPSSINCWRKVSVTLFDEVHHEIDCHDRSSRFFQ